MTHIHITTKVEFVSRFLADKAAINKNYIREADQYHRSAVGKQRKAKRRIEAQK